MRRWVKLMPYALVVWFARRHCERYTVDGRHFVCPFTDGPLLSIDAAATLNQQ